MVTTLKTALGLVGILQSLAVLCENRKWVELVEYLLAFL